MKSYKKVLIALDATATDDAIINYVNKLSQYFAIEKVVALHTVPVFKMGDLVKIDLKRPFKPVAPALELIRVVLESKMSALNDGIRWDIHIEEGRPYTHLLNFAESHKPDLLVMGRKKKSSASGITVKRVARNIISDVLIVPETLKDNEISLVAPVDFSEHSFRALSVAKKITNQINAEVPLDLLTVVGIPDSAMYPDGSRYERLLEEIRHYAKEDYNYFLDYYKQEPKGFNLNLEYTVNSISMAIYNAVVEKGKSLVIIGARGHGLVERFAFGSTAESLVELLRKQAVWIVR